MQKANFLKVLSASGIILIGACNPPEVLTINNTINEKLFSLEERSIEIEQINIDSALFLDDLGYQRIDFKKLPRTEQIHIVKQYKTIVIENDFIKLTLLPDRGKPYSLVYKISGNEEFFIPEIAQILRSTNKTGWWFILGGTEYTMPDEEHGETWAALWNWEITENSSQRKSIRMSVDERRFGLKESITITVFPDKAYYEAEIIIKNPTDSTIKFQHWINPMWVPGGDKHGLTPDTEFIIPTKEVYATERTFNKWMLNYSPDSSRLQPYENNPMRLFKNWIYYGDLLAWELEDGFYSAFSHEKNEGIVRIFPKDINPGCNIWTWGFDPDSSLRARFSGNRTNNGYVEMWGGITKGFDEFFSLESQKSLSWKEWMYPYINTKGLHFANSDFAVSFFRKDSGSYEINLCPSGVIKGVKLEAQSPSSGKTYKKIILKSDFPRIESGGFNFFAEDSDVELIISQNNKEIKRIPNKKPMF
jgi:hypothetical protein